MVEKGRIETSVTFMTADRRQEVDRDRGGREAFHYITSSLLISATSKQNPTHS